MSLNKRTLDMYKRVNEGADSLLDFATAVLCEYELLARECDENEAAIESYKKRYEEEVKINEMLTKENHYLEYELPRASRIDKFLTLKVALEHESVYDEILRKEGFRFL